MSNTHTVSKSRASATCRFCEEPIIYRHWNGHRAWTHYETGNIQCAPTDAEPTDAEPSELGKFTNGEEPSR